MAAIESEQPPEFPGLSVDARRAINIAAIAYAEVLCRRLADTPLLSLAKEATGRREPVDAYGGRPECEALIALIARARVIIESKTNVTQDVKARSDILRPLARYRNNLDTAPHPRIRLPGRDGCAGGRAARRPRRSTCPTCWPKTPGYVPPFCCAELPLTLDRLLRRRRCGQGAGSASCPAECPP